MHIGVQVKIFVAVSAFFSRKVSKMPSGKVLFRLLLVVIILIYASAAKAEIKIFEKEVTEIVGRAKGKNGPFYMAISSFFGALATSSGANNHN